MSSAVVPHPCPFDIHQVGAEKDNAFSIDAHAYSLDGSPSLVITTRVVAKDGHAGVIARRLHVHRHGLGQPQCPVGGQVVQVRGAGELERRLVAPFGEGIVGRPIGDDDTVFHPVLAFSVPEQTRNVICFLRHEHSKNQCLSRVRGGQVFGNKIIYYRGRHSVNKNRSEC